MCREAAWTELTAQVTSVVSAQSEMHGFNFIKETIRRGTESDFCSPEVFCLGKDFSLAHGKPLYYNYRMEFVPIMLHIFGGKE